MVEPITKISTTRIKPDELLEVVEEKVEFKCDITWETPSIGTRVLPPKDTVAIVVNLVDSPGAIRIFRDEKYIDGVFIDDSAGSQESLYTIVLWKNGWWFRASGLPKVGYVETKK
ncbi:hypothetical protein TSTA_110980 [Talaromyces stipitatus ATCC 10500]|uniref:Uncharacterized protein n=1 Tax=Talaromyces stipitatus (strain ATCC 10500 / CBS 375.48 / QM 6759 / NRRL 1006) TaxID=441959 RepID=B8MV26_TALSN|nr:uncharacterized protein TSTA_110980 [Talaromyces stipitatus ATCC 10500]XP_002488676.1 uncharacterized protein TSTA_110980 [Talaromyces stipitatus ATCC 10500]EED11919.1 hypothetical protein TSTA_110980 [Talaromyces stipitatus ATCC 10500]EED11920.1 hypothetical protein TSTA_110980 [Talaromyces stipitatus ATCC 10500]